MEDYVQAALNKGFRSLTFLEHLECGLLYEQQIWLTPDLFTIYFQEGERLQKQYAGRISIRLGVEIGWNAVAVDELRAVLARFPFEHRGLSCHFYFDGSCHLNLLSSREQHINALRALNPEMILENYFNSLLHACATIPCDKLCHLDAALRHLPDIRLTDRHQEQISDVLRLLRKKGIALEVNTSGYEIRPRPYPSLEITRQAAAMGIPLIAGSDAHHPRQVGRFFNRLRHDLFS
jgi:histidinol-phosphatase (PHP family)